MNRAISPIDGRYREKVQRLSNFFSEHALFQYRIKVEILYFIDFLQKVLKIKISKNQLNYLHSLYIDFQDKDFIQIKEIEKVTKHDVKAVEYFIKHKIEKTKLNKYSEFVHFGLTSQDINNTSVPLLMNHANQQEIIPLLSNILYKITQLAKQNRKVSMLSRTHGQAASPTTLGKEIFVFAERLKIQIDQLKKIKISGKFGGATGNFNAHKLAFPKINWPLWADQFLIKKLHIKRQKTTTQIAHYDEIAEFCHVLIRINTILLDFCKDLWTYISMEYFKQQVKAEEVGSSAMPHKVNPIDFENAEGNLGIANALFTHFAEKLPISRLQRDLTDSTVIRNIGTPIAHTFIALLAIQNGLEKISVNHIKIKEDLNKNWVVLAEAIQTILRREKVKGAYELLKDLTRGQSELSKEDIHRFIKSLKVNENSKQEMLKLTPFNYIGFASRF
ncbi:MAG: adenylosuccinate lyase [Saprospiraceae bacterium]|nr:adenylosuccinate lyase [Saprospiraceae bacterium]